MTVSRTLAVALIVLTPHNWWAVVVVWRAIRRRPEVHELRKQRVRFMISAGSATAMALVSVNYLLGTPLPRGIGFALLAVALLLISGPTAYFLFDYYRPQESA